MHQVKSNAKLKNLSAEALEAMWRFRYPEEGGTVLSYEAILVELPVMFGITSSLGALSEFYRWLGVKRRIESAKERADQVRLELAKDSDITPDDLERVAQTIFTSEAMEAGDVKSYVALATLRLNMKRTNLEERRIQVIEAKAKRLDEMEAKAKELKAGGGLTPEMLEMIEKQLKLL